MAGEAADSDVAQLRALAREFVEGFNSGDVDRIMRFYADRYVDVNMEQPKYAFVRGTILLFRVSKGERKPEPTQLRYVEVARKYSDGWKAIWGIDAPIHS